ncbi:MAG: hypothetical protein H7177_00535 [Rhizobacter sp.]|nr:hypothetical protein [Bacteriovorax sp.]
MKSFLILSLAVISLSANAHGIKRLTTTKCVSGSDTILGVLVKWDSSVSPLGPVSVKVNGEEVNPIMELGGDYLGLSGTLENKDAFSIRLTNEKEFETVLTQGNGEIPVACTTETKFKVF